MTTNFFQPKKSIRISRPFLSLANKPFSTVSDLPRAISPDQLSNEITVSDIFDLLLSDDEEKSEDSPSWRVAIDAAIAADRARYIYHHLVIFKHVLIKLIVFY